MKDGTACPAFFNTITAEISKVCVMVTVPVWWVDRSICNPLKNFKEAIRSEANRTCWILCM